MLFEVLGWYLAVETERVFTVIATELSEEHLELILLNLVASVPLLREYLPNLIEFLEIVLESLDSIVL